MMVGLAIAFMVLPFVFVCLRLWAKRIAKRVGWDDFLTIAALVRDLWAVQSVAGTTNQLRQAVSITCCSLQLASECLD
jgi:hypothetical protein